MSIHVVLEVEISVERNETFDAKDFLSFTEKWKIILANFTTVRAEIFTVVWLLILR